MTVISCGVPAQHSMGTIIRETFLSLFSGAMDGLITDLLALFRS